MMRTRRAKRWLLLGRLTEPDAAALSDREIARQLQVSQPFVSAVRRHSGPRSEHGRAAAAVAERQVPGDAALAVEESSHVERERAMRRVGFHHSQLGWTRTVSRNGSEDDDGGGTFCDCDGDPFKV